MAFKMLFSHLLPSYLPFPLCQLRNNPSRTHALGGSCTSPSAVLALADICHIPWKNRDHPETPGVTDFPGERERRSLVH